ncbi:type II toxin-antitoxin system Phd/YefM family antitoxin [Stutzerimonas stutzeri]|uniref:type II toxin-antitoxin system Phd/YefM family antitoxin n=1 Tax=Stutzerimonas stutzeri TaxID=316 RepID=UPI001CFC4E1D|nr:type II toxin-antitoxin system Phd/YefM family antitoxin [Stutzerimonas stutzeri]
MAFPLLADVAASIAELKRNPMRVIREGAGEAVVILHRNKPAFYVVPPALYEAMLEIVDDAYLAEVARARCDEPTVRLDIDGLFAK